MEKLKISAALIVKNEEEMLARALETVKEADEIVVVDTGSEDNTVEVAKKFTDKVYTDYKWEDHFGKARQQAMDRCTGDWIITIDADEMLVVPFDVVRTAIEEVDKQGANFLSIRVQNEKKPDQFLYFPRIYKNIPTTTWHGAAHNYLANSEGKKEVQTDDITIVYGYSPAHKKDPNRTLRILTKAVEEDPSLMRETFYLGREHWYKKNYEEAIKCFDAYVAQSKFRDERAEAYLTKARCLWNLRRGEEARVACLYAIYTNPDFKEALLFMADMNYSPRKEIWQRYAKHAKNTHVIFNRTSNADLST